MICCFFNMYIMFIIQSDSCRDLNFFVFSVLTRFALSFYNAFVGTKKFKCRGFKIKIEYHSHLLVILRINNVFLLIQQTVKWINVFEFSLRPRKSYLETLTQVWLFCIHIDIRLVPTTMTSRTERQCWILRLFHRSVKRCKGVRHTEVGKFVCYVFVS